MLFMGKVFIVRRNVFERKSPREAFRVQKVETTSASHASKGRTVQKLHELRTHKCGFITGNFLLYDEQVEVSFESLSAAQYAICFN